MGRLAIISGKGPQPADIAKSARDRGEAPLIIRIKQHCEDSFAECEVADFAIGELGAAISHIKSAGCDRVVFAGLVTRPPLNPLALDKEAYKLLGKVLLKGDNSALEAVADYFESHQIKVLPQSSFLDDRFLPKQFHQGRALEQIEIQSAQRAIATLRALGQLDIGQSVVAQGDRILAIEAAEGTDEMIARSTPLIQTDCPSAVFVKMAKSGQNLAFDPPGFGEHTIKQLTSAGIKIAVIEPEHVFLTQERETLLALAEHCGIVLVSTDMVTE